MEIKFKILCIFLILITLFSISSVAATEDADIISEDISQTDDVVDEIQTDEQLSEDLADSSFSSLSAQINDATGENVTIEGTYVYDNEKDSSLKDGITINKANDFKIIGKNLIINGNNNARAFNINSQCSIQLINVTFINCYAEGNGGAVNANSDVLLINCSFDNNFANMNGGAIYCDIETQSEFKSGMINTTLNRNNAINNYTSIYWKTTGQNILNNVTVTETSSDAKKNGFQLIGSKNFISASSLTTKLGINGELISQDSEFKRPLTVEGKSKFIGCQIPISFNVIDDANFTGGYVHELRADADIICFGTNFYRLYAYKKAELDNIVVSNEIGVDGTTIIKDCVFEYMLFNKGNMEIVSVRESPRLFIANDFGNVTFNLNPNHNTLNGCLLVTYEGGTYSVANGTTCILNGCDVKTCDFINNGGVVYFNSCDMEDLNLINSKGQVTIDVDFEIGYSLKNVNLENNGGKIDVPNGATFDHCSFKNNNGTVNVEKSLLLKGTLENYDKFNFKTGAVVDSKVYNEGTLSLDDVYTCTGLNINNNGTLNIAGHTNMTNSRLENTGKLIVSSSASISGLSIKKVDVKVVSDKVSMNYGASKYISLKVTDNHGKPVKNIKLTLTINRKNYHATSNDNGIATLKVPVLNVGTYTVNIKSGDNFYNVASKTTIKVNKAKTTVKVPKTVKKSKKLKITVKSKVTKKAAKSVKIKVKVYTGKKAKTYKLKTNKKGVAQLNTKKLTKGKHKLVITSLNKNYKISKKITIKVK